MPDGDNKDPPVRSLSRREALAFGAGTAAFTVVGGRAFASAQDAAAAIQAFTGGTVADRGGITIDLPETIEDGSTVPLSVAVESPMTATDYVSHILVVSEGNPLPRVVTFHFTPMSGRAEAATRIRLAKSQNIIVVARTSDGRLLSAEKRVEVTVGACTGS
jgi:sulfur-oxidizing protein SoxY